MRVRPTSGAAALPVTMTFTGFGGIISNIYWGDGPATPGPISGTLVPGTPLMSYVASHTYYIPGTFGVTVTISNPHVPNLMRICTANVIVTGKGVPSTT